jgi:hypothetical protein
MRGVTTFLKPGAAADLVVFQQLLLCRRHVLAALIGMDQASIVAAILSRLPVLAFSPCLYIWLPD